MNTKRWFHPLEAAVVIAAMSLALPGATAQERPDPVPPPASSRANSTPEAHSISLTNAPLGVALPAVCKEFGVEYVIAPVLAPIEVKELNLKLPASLEKILDAMKIACGNKFEYRLEAKDGAKTVYFESLYDVNQANRWIKIDLDIVGGRLQPKPGAPVIPATMRAIVGYLGDRFPTVNLVLSPGAEDITIQNLKLRSAGLENALQALSVATDGQVQPKPLGGDGTSFALFGNPTSTVKNRTVEVFNLTPYLQSLGIKTGGGQSETNEQRDRISQALIRVHSMIASTMELAGQKDEAHPLLEKTRFHDGANLLVVAGSPAAIEVVGKVVAALNQTTSSVRSSSNQESAPAK